MNATGKLLGSAEGNEADYLKDLISNPEKLKDYVYSPIK